MKNLEKHRGDSVSQGAVALGVSVDTIPSRKAWAEDLSVEHVQMLADFYPRGQIAESYEMLRDRNLSERAMFVLDKDGSVLGKDVCPISEQSDVDEILKAVETGV